MGTLPRRPFGRLKSIDPKDRLYPLRAVINMADVPVARTQPWHYTTPLLDQGLTGVPDRDNEGSCTGFGGANFLAAAPYMHQLDGAFALKLYDLARQNDEWTGTDYEGSSVRGLMKAMLSLNLIRGGYLWAFHAATVRDYVLRYGPVIMGTDWYANMMDPNKEGYITPTGTLEGGHCYNIAGYSATRNAFRQVNNWGEGWGDRGRSWIHFDHLAFLLESDGGEAVSAVEVARPISY